MTGVLRQITALSLLVAVVTAARAQQRWVGTGERVAAWGEAVPADRVRLGVRDEGVYRVTAGEIAAASGRATNDVLAALAADGLHLSCRGRPVAWDAEGGALFFYGRPTDELYAPENVYWLAFAPGARMERLDAAPEPSAGTNAWFLSASGFRAAFVAPYDPRDRRSTNGTLTNVLNFGEWVQASATEATRTRSRQVALEGFDETAATGLVARVEAASYRDFESSDSHACEVWLNGVFCGSHAWAGEQAVAFDVAVPPGVVTNGPVQLAVRNGLTLSPRSDFLLLDLALLYPRRYEAPPADAPLLCAGGAEGTVAVSGFASALARVWDVTEAEAPLALAGDVWQATNGLWSAAFLCGDAATRYAVFTADGGCFEPSLAGARDTDWSDPAEMPELAIVIPPRRWVGGFDAAVQPLADFREAQGLRTRVVDAQELYDAFTDGLVHPEAFRRFCAAGVTNAAGQRLRYLLLAGYGGCDYKLDAFGFGEKGPYPTLLPCYLYSDVEETVSPAAAILVPNDTVLGLVSGAGVPDVAVGRLLATNAVEASRMVAKTIRYELTETWKRKGIFVACRKLYANDPDFSAVTAQTAGLASPGGWVPAAFYPQPPTYPLNVLWEDTYSGTGALYELREGSGFFYYVGHSSDTVVGVSSSYGSYVFKNTTLQAGTWSFAPVALLLGCRMGRWSLWNVKTRDQSVSEAGVRNPVSGFVAVISAAGYTIPADANSFSYKFAEAMTNGHVRLGDVWCAAFRALGAGFVTRNQHLSLLGDPSLTFRATATARGTSADWLIAHGLTGDPYADLADQDSDGFATWQEGQAGTSPTSAVVRVRAFGAGAPGGASLTFEPVGGYTYRVVSATSLVGAAWSPVTWRAGATGEWTSAGIPADWPVKALEVPVDPAERQRFYRVESLPE